MVEKYSRGHYEVIRKLLKPSPGIREGKMFGYPAFFKDGRMFACVYGEGIGIKLPLGEVAAQLLLPHVIPFQPYGRSKMREWVQINRLLSEEYAQDMEILRRSMWYVAGAGSGDGK